MFYIYIYNSASFTNCHYRLNSNFSTTPLPYKNLHFPDGGNVSTQPVNFNRFFMYPNRIPLEPL